MDKVEFFQKKVDTFLSKESAEKKRSLKLIISFSAMGTGYLGYQLFSQTDEFIENTNLKDILNISFLERSAIKLKGITEEIIHEAIKKWLANKAVEMGIKKEQLQGMLKLNGEYALLNNKTYLKELKINEII